MRRAAAVIVLLALATPASRAESLDLVAPIDGPVARHFEPPPTPYAAGHRGIDFAAEVGSSVVAAAAGTVAFAGAVGGTFAVSIDHAGGYRTTYSFLSGVSVRRGAQVAQGAPIGRSGAGHEPADQPELHFGLRRGEEYLDPEPFLVASMRSNLHRVLRLAA